MFASPPLPPPVPWPTPTSESALPPSSYFRNNSSNSVERKILARGSWVSGSRVMVANSTKDRIGLNSVHRILRWSSLGRGRLTLLAAQLCRVHRLAHNLQCQRFGLLQGDLVLIVLLEQGLGAAGENHKVSHRCTMIVRLSVLTSSCWLRCKSPSNPSSCPRGPSDRAGIHEWGRVRCKAMTHRKVEDLHFMDDEPVTLCPFLGLRDAFTTHLRIVYIPASSHTASGPTSRRGSPRRS